jgi:hypothetical protein
LCVVAIDLIDHKSCEWTADWTKATFRIVGTGFSALSE